MNMGLTKKTYPVQFEHVQNGIGEGAITAEQETTREKLIHTAQDLLQEREGDP